MHARVRINSQRWIWNCQASTDGGYTQALLPALLVLVPACRKQPATGSGAPQPELSGRLRALPASPGARLKDLIGVKRELVRVPSELDSLASRSKALAQQTEMIRVTLH